LKTNKRREQASKERGRKFFLVKKKKGREYESDKVALTTLIN